MAQSKSWMFSQYKCCPRLTSTPTTNCYDSQSLPGTPYPLWGHGAHPQGPFDHRSTTVADVKAQIHAVLSEVLPHLEATEHVQRDPGQRCGEPQAFQKGKMFGITIRDRTSWCNSMLSWFLMDEHTFDSLMITFLWGVSYVWNHHDEE